MDPFKSLICSNQKDANIFKFKKSDVALSLLYILCEGAHGVKPVSCGRSFSVHMKLPSRL
jgi:hypothetical protein